MVHRRVGRFIKRRFRRGRLKAPPIVRRIITKRVLPREVLTGTLPISPVGAVGVVGGAGGKIGGFIKGVGAKIQQFGKPVTFKTGVQSVGSRFFKGLGVTTGVTAIETAITGEPFNPLGRRPLLGAAGFAVGGVPGLVAGSLLGGIKVGTREAVKLGVGGAGFVGGVVQDQFNFPSFPNQPAGNTVNIDFGDAPAIQPGAVGGLTGGGGASFNIGAGTGGGDLSGLILLLLGLGGAGALLATRKKRKKKKKKKKRKKLKRKLRELEEED